MNGSQMAVNQHSLYSQKTVSRFDKDSLRQMLHFTSLSRCQELMVKKKNKKSVDIKPGSDMIAADRVRSSAIAIAGIEPNQLRL